MCIDQIIDSAKQAMWLIISTVVSIFAPVQNILILLFLAFLFNIITGIITDVHVNKKPFNIKKAFNALSQLLFYFACVIFIDYGANLLNDTNLGTMGVKWLTCIVVYFYLTNIFKNARLVYPENLAIGFIYELLSTEIFDRLKTMGGFKTKKNNENGTI